IAAYFAGQGGPGLPRDSVVPRCRRRRPMNSAAGSVQLVTSGKEGGTRGKHGFPRGCAGETGLEPAIPGFGAAEPKCPLAGKRPLCRLLCDRVCTVARSPVSLDDLCGSVRGFDRRRELVDGRVSDE